MKKGIVLGLLMTLFIVNPVNSEPSKTITHLMDEPVSMFDWGMHKLNKDINGFFTALLHPDYAFFKKIYNLRDSNMENIKKQIEFSDFETDVYYDWDKNRIIIHVQLINKNKNLSVATKKAMCQKYTNLIKAHYYTDNDKKYRKMFGVSSFFGHTSYAKKNAPADLTEHIENITKIKITVLYSKLAILYAKDWPLNLESDYKIIASESPLMAYDIYYKETEN